MARKGKRIRGIDVTDVVCADEHAALRALLGVSSSGGLSVGPGGVVGSGLLNPDGQRRRTEAVLTSRILPARAPSLCRR